MIKPIRDWIMPKTFLAGVLVGMIGLSILGKAMVTGKPFYNFKRFNHHICFETQYLPTALQVRETAKSILRKDKICVIIGGASVFNGWGQRGTYIWTDLLQTALGDDYRVVNLAMTCTSPNEVAMLTAETLLDEYPKLIYVGDFSIGSTVALLFDGCQHPYFFWDNYYRDLVPNWELRNEAIRESQWLRTNTGYDELIRCGELNSRLNFTDLWNSIGYRFLFTVYDTKYKVSDNFLTPRANLPDEPVKAWDYKDRLESDKMFPANTRDELISELQTGSQLDTSPKRVEICFPESMRKRSIIVFEPHWSVAKAKLNQSELEKLDNARIRAKKAIQKLGITVRDYQTEFPPECFVDSVHLDETGGEILADLISHEIRAKAKELGYEK